jgi:uncharacterized membrane protein
MSVGISFQVPLVWQVGLPFAAALLALAAWRQHRHGLSFARILTLATLRLLVLGSLLLLASRPVTVDNQSAGPDRRHVVVLLDRSESMSIRDQNETRFEQAAGFLQKRLLGALGELGVSVDTVVFDESPETVAADKLTSLKPNGRRTNLGGAIAQTLAGSPVPPVAVVALTDGKSNQNNDNARAWSGLSENRIPFIAVGFGSDQGARSLSLRTVEVPRAVAARTSFHVSAQLEMLNGVQVPPVQLLLLRDGDLLQTRTVEPGAGSRMWLESFQVTEEQAGTHNYTVQLMPPEDESLKCANLAASASVRIEDERELRVLYIQGALTWDYKFVSLALRADGSVKLTGLVRTSEKSVFRQNVEAAGELLNGFPQTIEELAPFRVIVLSNLRPNDLTAGQQDLLARFCGERGGGLLVLGGPWTFNSSWRGTRLEKMLPVTIGSSPGGARGVDRPFHPELTREGKAHPVFRINEDAAPEAAWKKLPAFSDYGRVDAPKPGAEVWAVHPSDQGPFGRRILMATQRYGAGISAVICIQNFWRWRLAPDQKVAEHDRFWRQIFRYLSEAGRQDVSIQFAEQELQPRNDVQVLLALQPNPSIEPGATRNFTVRVETGGHRVVKEQTVRLQPLRPAEFSFRAEKPDLYSVIVTDPALLPIASRTVDIRDGNKELENTARDMENLRQWAAVSDGLALRAEDCPDASDLVATIRGRISRATEQIPQHRPYGINAWVLGGVLGLLSVEWFLRKKWRLV